ncbi:Helix-turn-helix domain-containing protein [Rhodovastum atsumiense]|uniref:Helix-turn-helix domain-containing protein n=1 Tax=Rhodovastum atsumiense TaxID=504468 RepID=A0A5M6IU68_9PROT|nr:XRE family transcriptional regulator [Rhodovastum atsumiense]KAA5611479.1 helix-turn-helix domain-containing protein [Rhodovastum atsumiense]CAH2601170.1 Helix-turn-helix domain-containing protein [Rhodovastum atsumiense]
MPDSGSRLPDDPDEPHTNSSDEAAGDLPAILGHNLRRLRTRQGHSLERLAKLSGVSRAMLGQIENGKSVPTISTLWKISGALGVPFARLLAAEPAQHMTVMRRDEAKVLSSSEGHFTSRALFPFDETRQVEFYELRLAPHHREVAAAHAPGTRENLIVISGVIEITVGTDRPCVLAAGDAILFDADLPHIYHNLSDTEAVIYLVMTYTTPIG